MSDDRQPVTEVVDKVTLTALDVLWLLLLSAGVALGAWPSWGGWSLAAAAVPLFAGVRVADGSFAAAIRRVRGGKTGEADAAGEGGSP